MRNWFLISVAILVLSFSVIYFMMQSPDTPDLAPGSGGATCENTNVGSRICTGDEVCIRTLGSVTAVISRLSNGGCPPNYSPHVVIDTDKLGLCTLSQQKFDSSGNTVPPICANGCLDIGMKKFKFVVSDLSPVTDEIISSCCISGIERICEDKPWWQRGGILNPNGW